MLSTHENPPQETNTSSEARISGGSVSHKQSISDTRFASPSQEETLQHFRSVHPSRLLLLPMDIAFVSTHEASALRVHQAEWQHGSGLAICRHGILAMTIHRWVPFDTHSTPVPETTERLWVVPNNTSSHAQCTPYIFLGRTDIIFCVDFSRLLAWTVLVDTLCLFHSLADFFQRMLQIVLTNFRHTSNHNTPNLRVGTVLLAHVRFEQLLSLFTLRPALWAHWHCSAFPRKRTIFSPTLSCAPNSCSFTINVSLLFIVHHVCFTDLISEIWGLNSRYQRASFPSSARAHIV